MGSSSWPTTIVERTIWLAKSLGVHPPVVEQPPYHMNFRLLETPEGLIDVVRYHGLGLVCFEALATGLFTETYADFILNSSPFPAEGGKFHNNEISNYVRDRYVKVLPGLLKLSKQLEIGLNHLALAWSLRLQEVTTSLMGASKPEQIIDNCKALDVKISSDLEKEIDLILANRPDEIF